MWIARDPFAPDRGAASSARRDASCPQATSAAPWCSPIERARQARGRGSPRASGPCSMDCRQLPDAGPERVEPTWSTTDDPRIVALQLSNHPQASSTGPRGCRGGRKREAPCLICSDSGRPRPCEGRGTPPRSLPAAPSSASERERGDRIPSRPGARRRASGIQSRTLVLGERDERRAGCRRDSFDRGA